MTEPAPGEVFARLLDEVRDELPGGVQIVGIFREAVGRTVRVLTDEPRSITYSYDDPVPVVRRIW